MEPHGWMNEGLDGWMAPPILLPLLSAWAVDSCELTGAEKAAGCGVSAQGD